jgi:hypothetical protein
MKKTIIGSFAFREDAENFINYVHTKLSIPHEDISYVYRNIEDEVKEVDSEKVSSNKTSENVKQGAKIGTAVGVLGGIAAVAGIIPPLGALFVAGPLVTGLGITGALGAATAAGVTGAATGGLIGALASIGVSEAKSQKYNDLVLAGNILVIVNCEKQEEITKAMRENNAQEIEVYQVDV